MGRLSRARYVQHPRNAGWPEGREPHGHGVSVVVRGRESRPHGEGRQVVGQPRRRGTRDAKRRSGLGSHKGHWRAAVRSKDSSPVRRGAVGKGLREMHLAGRLPDCLSGSTSGVWKRSEVIDLSYRATPRLYLPWHRPSYWSSSPGSTRSSTGTLPCPQDLVRSQRVHENPS